MNFPKILIIGQPLNRIGGGGVTICSLFTGWPKDKLAVASNVNLLTGLDTSIGDTYYQLGYNNKLHPFPFSIVLPKINCGLLPVNDNRNKDAAKAAPTTEGKFKGVYDILTALLHFFGLYHVFYKLKITPEFSAWVKEYNPDIIYTQLASLELIRFVDELHEKTKKPVAIHIMDDWPSTINKPGIFYNYWKNYIDKAFRKLLNKTSIFLSISDAMSDEYKERYGKDFVPFHNPIDVAYWKPKTPKDYAVKDKFTLLYPGRVGNGIEDSITDIAHAVNEIAVSNKDIVFEIQTPDVDTLNKLNIFNDQVKWVPPIVYAEIPKRFSSVDVLLLPQDFDETSVKFLKYSFPTKVSEYMISGTPILVYGDPQTAVTKNALKDKWAVVVTEKNKATLIKAINDLYNDISLRKQLAEKAQQIAIEREDAIIVREQFRKSFILN